ncbi:hypothetical protein RMCN_0271 [Mycolicibacterium novocastrense]|uniref:Uncharacterized protein n=1 Tax=Mycolicibacterium novocastrense TaxID=59813 RepID=A0ABQ0KC94_MYCNV|nr:hypothetical protein RMCN_0271 [Mycolicibacterium novocastrense]
MTALLVVVCMTVEAPLAALCIHDLQARLERWDQNRHAED